MSRERLEPTAVLAALIIGNHRHVNAHAAGGDAAAHPSGNAAPTALVTIFGGPVEAPAALFSRVEGEVLVVDPGERGSGSVAAALESAAREGLPLVVMLSSISTHRLAVPLGFRESEAAMFAALEHTLGASPAAIAAVRAGRMRIVAALVEEATRRVHWLGEHPRLSQLLGEA